MEQKPAWYGTCRKSFKIEDPLEFYRQKYPDGCVRRGDLDIHDPNLYRTLWNRGLLDAIPTVSDLTPMQKEARKKLKKMIQSEELQ